MSSGGKCARVSHHQLGKLRDKPYQDFPCLESESVKSTDLSEVGSVFSVAL